MNEVLHANIFFVIASVATVIFCILISLVLWQLLKITRSVRAIVERIEEASELVAEDVRDVREFVRSGGMFSRFFSFIMGTKFGATRKRKRGDDED
tara:strand:+ start:11386 stop:11673 length:288 start_codon:yes stop_codon:yes gene_type:complete